MKSQDKRVFMCYNKREVENGLVFRLAGGCRLHRNASDGKNRLRYFSENGVLFQISFSAPVRRGLWGQRRRIYPQAAADAKIISLHFLHAANIRINFYPAWHPNPVKRRISQKSVIYQKITLGSKQTKKRLYPCSTIFFQNLRSNSCLS